MNEKSIMEKYDKLNRKMQRYFSSFFTGTAVTSIQALVLQYLIVETKKRDVFPKDLEEFLEIKPSSVTSLISNLERNGYLRRESLAKDGRYKKLVLTEKTMEMEEEIEKCIDRDYLFPDCIVYYAVGACINDFYGACALIHSSSLCGFHDGSSRSGDGDYWSVCKRRYTTDIMGIIRRTTLLDRMGRVYLRILCTSL